MWKRRLGIVVVVLLVGLAALYATLAGPALKIATGYHAAILGSAVFLAERDPADVLEHELGFLSFVQAKIDREAGTVDSSVFGLARTRSLYRPGFGVTLVHEDEAALRAQPLPTPMTPPVDYATQPWPLGNAPDLAPMEADAKSKLEEAVARAFEEPNADKPRNTRAVLVVQDGKLLAERYAEGFDRDIRLAGWSNTKSVTSALIGILVRDGKLDIHAPAPVPEWRAEGDARGALTLDQLLRMSSGLEFAEEYFNPFADATRMLFASPSAAALAAAKPLAHEPDTVWYYSSGTTNILSRIIGEHIGSESYADFANRELFEPIGMYSMIMSPDEQGDFVGSSFGWATARDWARFGQLYLQDGVWNGKRILPEGWVKYSVTPTPPAPKGEYGAQWWLNAGPAGKPEERPIPEAPADVYYASGFEGQRVFVLPSHKAIVVRLGFTQSRGAFPWGVFLRDILDALPQPAAE